MISKSSNTLLGRNDNLLLLRSRLSRILSKPLKAPGLRLPMWQLWKSNSFTPVSRKAWSWIVLIGLFLRLVKLIHLKFWKEVLLITLMLFSWRFNLSSFNLILEKLSSIISILLLDKSSVFSVFMLEMAIKGIFPRRLLARLSVDKTGTPFWKAIEWIFMMLLRLRSKLNNCFRFQNTPRQELSSGSKQKEGEQETLPTTSSDGASQIEKIILFENLSFSRINAKSGTKKYLYPFCFNQLNNFMFCWKIFMNFVNYANFAGFLSSNAVILSYII